MRFAFINNFEQILAQAVSASDTTITLDGGGDQMSDASAELVYVLTLFHVDSNGNETQREIVHVVGTSGNTLTVERAQEGTTPQAWVVGDGVSQRVTAGVLSALGEDESTGTFPVQIGSDITIENEYNEDPLSFVAIGQHLIAEDESVSIGVYAEAKKWQTVAVGISAWAHDYQAVAYGIQSQAQGESFGAGFQANAGAFRSVAVGSNALAGGEESTAVGRETHVYGAGSTGLGVIWFVRGEKAIAAGYNSRVGQNSSNPADYAAAYGPGCWAYAPSSLVMGRGAGTTQAAEHGIAMGTGARANIKGGVVVAGVPYLRAEPDALNTHSSVLSDLSAESQPEVCRSTSSQVVIASKPLDLTDTSAEAVIDMPAGVMLFIDSIDVVIVASSGAGGSPEIVVGPDDESPTDYLAATAVTKTAVGGCESHDPIVTDGVTSLRVATAVAGSGTTYQAKIVFRGYVMEL